MANRFWVGGTGNFNDTAHWATTSGGAGGQTVPGSGDAILVDNHASGLNGGTLTIDIDITAQSFNWTAAVGTIDNSANHNVTLSATAGFNGSGTTARTFLGGTGTYTLSAAGGTFNVSVTTALTNPTTAFASCTITFSGVSGTTNAVLNNGGCALGTVNLNANKGMNLSGTSGTFSALNITGPNSIRLNTGTTLTITNAFAWTGTSANPILIINPASNVATISTGSGTANTAAWCGFDHIAFTAVGGSTLTAINSMDFGFNSGTGFTITAPSVGAAGVIGG